jgi:uncharacterized protein YjiS (DUF1127 family)
MNTFANAQSSAWHDCGVLTILGLAIGRGVARLIAWRAQQAAISYLMAMSDRQLHDIGLEWPETEFAVTDEPMLGRGAKAVPDRRPGLSPKLANK